MSAERSWLPCRGAAASPWRRRLGIGLVEAAVATVLVGILLVAALGTVDASVRIGNATAERSRASAFGWMLMSEITRLRYEEPTDGVAMGVESPETTTSRATWDDVDDYHGFSQSPPTHIMGAEVAGARNWTWKVDVAHADVADPSRSAPGETGLKRITVTVVDPQGDATTYVALRSRFGPRDRLVGASTSFVGHVGMHLEVGGGIKGNVTSGSVLVNEPAP